MDDPDLIADYLGADLNRTGKLSFEELQAFQKKLVSRFAYMPNESALKPDEFRAAGGGDCEDFALYTAGLLRFWGWEPYIGSLAPEDKSLGHAVCLSYEEASLPKGFAFFMLESWTAQDGTGLKAGAYVPIDYQHVGSLSNAVGEGWLLREVYLPEKVYGLTM